MSDIVIYSSDYCAFCQRAKALLGHKNAPFREVKVDFDPGKRAEMRQKAGSNTVPQIWIDGAHIGGCDDLYLLEETGKLDALLGKQA